MQASDKAVGAANKLNKPIVISIDAFGGDNAPDEIIKGAVTAINQKELQDKNVIIQLVGNESSISAKLAVYTFDKDRIRIVHAPEVIGYDESPTVAIKKKKDSSIVVGLNQVKNQNADAFISAGSTGAVLAGATVIIGRITGVERPALATLLPNEKGFSLLIDCGANVDSKPSYYLQFAKMGSIYMENIRGLSKPKIALVNIGAEREKGNAATKEAFELIESSGLNFIGNIEARDIPFCVADVVVCDGFVGNVILKYTEGFSKAFMSMIKAELMSGTLSKIGAMLAKGSFKNLKKRMDYAEIGGAPFLGLKKLVVKAHGSSDYRAIVGAIKQCIIFVENDVCIKIEKQI